MKIAVLDDWLGAAQQCIDWAPLAARAELTFFPDAFETVDAAVAALADYDVLMAMRERTTFDATLIGRLPKLRMIAMTGRLPGSLDVAACTAAGVIVTTTEGQSMAATAELTLGLMLAVARHIPAGDAAMRRGAFQAGVGLGEGFDGKTLGIVGLGRIGARMAKVGAALGMRVIAWSPNLTPDRAEAAGASAVTKEDLFERADVVTIHVVLSARSRGLVGAADLARMKPRAILLNTSRWSLIDEDPLLAALREGRIRAGIDVYGREPLPADHPIRTMPGTVLTPHLGYCTAEVFAQYYGESRDNVLAFLDGAPTNAVNPEAFA
jgi:phosphoglycerate dehydrogenase-like enzyme